MQVSLFLGRPSISRFYTKKSVRRNLLSREIRFWYKQMCHDCRENKENVAVVSTNENNGLLRE